ncbi:MAG: hypothetical protein IJ668_11960 [Selenomonadaceae bacterium]|nr:hypothetical protein [Selenomonadaceae bacterium]
MQIQLSRMIFVRVDKLFDVDTVEELITATEKFDELTDDLHVTTPYFDDDVYLTVEGTVPDVDEYSPLCSFISDNYSDDEWFHSVDEYIDYVNTQVEHPLHGTSDEDSAGDLTFDLQRFADDEDQKKVLELRQAFRKVCADAKKEYFALGEAMSRIDEAVAERYSDDGAMKDLNDYCVDVSIPLFGALVKADRLAQLLSKIDSIADKA